MTDRLKKIPSGFERVRPVPWSTARGSCCYKNDNMLIIVALKGGVDEDYNAVKQRSSPVDSYLKTI